MIRSWYKCQGKSDSICVHTSNVAYIVVEGVCGLLFVGAPQIATLRVTRDA